MKNRAISFLITLCLLAAAFPCAAAEGESGALTVTRDKNTIVVAGAAADADYVTVLITYPDQTLDTRRDTAIDASGVIAAAELVSAASGSYHYTLPIGAEGPFGVYAVSVGISGAVYTETIRYTRVGAAYEEELKNAVNSSTDLIETLLEYNDLVLLDEEQLAALPQELEGYFEETLSSYLPVSDLNRFLENVLHHSETVFAINDLNNAPDKETFFALAREKAETLGIVFDVTTPLAAELFDKAFAARPIYNETVFEEMNETYVVAELNNASWGAYERLIRQYPMIGIDLDSETKDFSAARLEALYGALAESAPFAGLTEFQTKFRAAKEASAQEADPKPTQKPSNNGGNGGGGGSSRYSGVTQTPPITPVSPGTQPFGGETNGIVFTDLEQFSWAEESIRYLAEKNVVSGVGGNKFNPGGNIKREEFVKMILNAFDYTVKSGRTQFADVENGAWYENYVYTAQELGLVSGVSETGFGTGADITRQDAAVILNRVLAAQGLRLNQADGKAPADLQEIADYAQDAVTAMFAANVLTGNEFGAFMPQNSLTRAQAAKMIYGILNAER